MWDIEIGTFIDKHGYMKIFHRAQFFDIGFDRLVVKYFQNYIFKDVRSNSRYKIKLWKKKLIKITTSIDPNRNMLSPDSFWHHSASNVIELWVLFKLHAFKWHFWKNLVTKYIRRGHIFKMRNETPFFIIRAVSFPSHCDFILLPIRIHCRK